MSQRPILLDTARESYSKAVNLFQSKHTRDDFKVHRVKQFYEISDVLDVVSEAKTKYEGRVQESKARRYLGALSSRIMYYAQIMDMLSQHHPEYVSLAWGTMKFLFVLVLNHEEMISELAKAVSKIADVLPRVKIDLETFRTEWMKDAVQNLYAEIINFLVRSLQWYEQSPLKHAWKAFTSPYKLRFQDIRDRIDEHARNIDSMASTLSRATISQSHSLLLEIGKKMEALAQMEKSLNANHLVYLSRFSGLDRSVQEIQVDLILKATKSTPLPDPMETLRFCQALRRRRSGKYDFDLRSLAGSLKQWSEAQSSSMIILGGKAPTRFQTKDLATEMVECIESAKKPAMWILKGRQGSSSIEARQMHLLKQMVNQAAQINTGRMIRQISEGFNAPRVESARTESDWLQILGESLTGLAEVFFVVDMEALGYSSEGDMASWLEFLRGLEVLTSNFPGVVVRVALLSFRPVFVQSLKAASSSATVIPLNGRPGIHLRGGSRAKVVLPWRRKKDSILRLS